MTYGAPHPITKTMFLAFALAAATTLTGCKNDKSADDAAKAAEAAAQEKAANTLQITGWDDKYAVNFEGLKIILPPSRVFTLNATGFCPSLSGKVADLAEYKQACRAHTEAEAQRYIDGYACGGKGDTFYAYMPTTTREAALPFSTDTKIRDINPKSLFTVADIKYRYEKFHQGGFTVSDAFRTGTSTEPRQYGADCTAHFAHNLGERDKNFVRPAAPSAP